MSAGNDDQVQDDDEDDCMTSIEPVVQSPSFTRSKAILVVWAILCLFCYLLVLQVIHSIGRYHSLISEPEKEFCHSEANDNSTVTTSSDRSVQSQTSSLMKKLSNLIFQATTSFAVYDLSTNGSSKRKSEAAAAVVIASASMDSVRLTRDTNQHTEKVIMFPLAHTTSPNLSPDQISLLRQFSYRVIKYIPDLPARASLIPWGGGSLAPWWTPTMKTNPNNEDVDHVPGGRLLWYYYKILRHYMSDISNLDHGVHFPLGLCRHQGCPAEISIAHTLQWRELYQPFRFTPAMVQENRNGFCYTRGFSLVSSDKTLNGHHPYGRHAMVWMRLGRHKVIDGLTYYRVVLHSIDKAVGAALQASDQRVGKFNVLFDGTDFELRKVPEMKYGKLPCIRVFFVTHFEEVHGRLSFL